MKEEIKKAIDIHLSHARNVIENAKNCCQTSVLKVIYLKRAEEQLEIAEKYIEIEEMENI